MKSISDDNNQNITREERSAASDKDHTGDIAVMSSRGSVFARHKKIYIMANVEYLETSV